MAGLALVTQDLQNGRSALLGYLDVRVFQLDDVYLEGFHEKIPLVPATRAG